MRRPTGTEALLATGVGLTATAVGLEARHEWRRGRDPRETVELAVAGYQAGSRREHAMLNLLVAYAATAGVARVSTHLIRSRGTFGPFRNRRWGDRHIHHFVPGIILLLVAGGASILTTDEGLEPKLAVPFGVGMGLTLDESALLLELDDVYWTPEGLLGVQITLAVTALIGALSLGVRFVRRGEQLVLPVTTPDGTRHGVGAVGYRRAP